MNLSQLRFRVSLIGALLMLVAAVFVVADDAPTAEGEDGPAVHRLFVPATGCDSCEPQDIRLYYLGMRGDAGPSADRRVRDALFSATNQRFLSFGADAPAANVSLALSPITPDRESSFIGDRGSPYGTGYSPQWCDNVLWSAGYPTRQDARRVVLQVDIADNDPVAEQLARTLDKQWLRCEAGLVYTKHPAAVLAQRIASGEAEAFITTIDVSPSNPYDLVPRLFRLDSPENFVDIVPTDPSASVEPLLAQAAAAISESEKELLYSQVLDRVLGSPIGNYPSRTYLGVLPLLWRYDVNGHRPPVLDITNPQYLLLNFQQDTITITGSVTPGWPGAKIRQVTIDWGDGTREAVTLPASHRYAPATQSTYKQIIISARQSDGTVSWQTRWVGHYPP